MGNESVYWFSIPPQDAWIVLPVEDRKLVSLITNGRDGINFKIAGYHMGETKWIGELQNILAIKMESVPASARNKILPKILEALGGEFKGAEILFLDEKYAYRRKNQHNAKRYKTA